MQIGIIGGGPAALFMLKQLSALGCSNMEISIFERKDRFGCGMPYSKEGAGNEHVTNVSGNEIPNLHNEVKNWIHKAPMQILKIFDITTASFNDYKVLPRILFGEYLSAQFEKIYQYAKDRGLKINLFKNTEVTDVESISQNKIKVYTDKKDVQVFDIIIICTGHNWPKIHEGDIPGWYDSPYPPDKLEQKVNYQVAIRGASLTAIDAIRTLSRANGSYFKNKNGGIAYKLHPGSERFRMVLHSLHGLLPAIRFHLEAPKLKSESLDQEEMDYLMSLNNGFIPIDYIFDKCFKLPLRDANREFYEKIKEMSIEQFVTYTMDLRERINAFDLFKAEYTEAAKSIERKKTVYWKEILAELSYAMNYPAKHFSAEDMLRLKKTLMPLISIVIAFVPQSSCRELLALYDAGVLDLVAVDDKSDVRPLDDESGILYTYTNDDGLKQEAFYKMFIDAIGQRPMMLESFPFEGLRNNGVISQAYLKFRSNNKGEHYFEENPSSTLQQGEHYYLKVPGININDSFQVLDKYNACNIGVYIMAVPYISGLNPDYSGLDFCETAAERISKSIALIYYGLENS